MSQDLKAGTPLVYVDGGCDCVLIYRQDKGTLVGLITLNLSFGTGMTTDSKGTLFVGVGQPGGAYFIAEYPPGSMEPSTSLEVPELPFDVAVASDGTVYVSGSGPVPAVYVYANGATRPTSELLDTYAFGAFGIAVNQKGNVFWGIQTASGYQIDRFVHGTKFPIRLGISLTDRPESLNFDGEGRLIVTQPDVPAIDVFVLPDTLVKQFGQSGLPYGAARGALRYAWVSDYNGGPGSEGSLREYSYKDGSLIREIALSGCCGAFDVAVYPLP